MNKIRDLTALLGAEAHLLRGDEAPEQFVQVLDQPLSPAILDTIVRMRAQSDAYLKTAVTA
jgi:hypothetical protein